MSLHRFPDGSHSEEPKTGSSSDEPLLDAEAEAAFQAATPRIEDEDRPAFDSLMERIEERYGAVDPPRAPSRPCIGLAGALESNEQVEAPNRIRRYFQ